MHFCKANQGVCGEEFILNRLTEDEQRILKELNSVFSELSVDSAADAAPVFQRDEALKKIEDRMEKLKELMKQM